MMALEDIEKDLTRFTARAKNRGRKYSVSKKPKEEKTERPSEFLIEKEAEEIFEEKFTPALIKKIVFGGIIFSALIVGGVILFISLSGGSGASDIDIQIYAPNEIYRGVPLDINLDVNNGSQNILRDATLILNSTNGLINLSAAANSSVFTQSIGDLGIGSLSKENYKFLAMGDPKSNQTITVTLAYTLSNGNRFEVNKTVPVSIKEPAIQLTVQKPEQILSGSAFEFEVDYQNKSSFDFPAVALDTQYPDAYQFVSASIDPTSLNDHWDLGELAAGSKGSLKIKGTLNGSSNSVFPLTVSLSAKFNGQNYELGSAPLNLTIAASPIGLEIAVNGRSDYTARLGDKLTYTIQYQNNSGIALADVAIHANLTGDIFDYSTLNTNANINSLTNSLTWNTSNTESLRLLDPGSSGSVSFSITLKNIFPIQRLNDKNFILRIDAVIDSPSVPYYLSASKTEAVSSLITKVGGLISVATKSFYRDADSGILNIGNLPPKVGQTTQYTIHWQITNYSTDADNVTVSAPLAQGVSWTGQVKSNIDSVPLYDSGTGLVTWTIPKIIATKGVISDPVEAIFQVAATPSASQVGNYELLLGETSFTATDDFTGANLSSSAPALSTNLIYDPTVGQNNGRVVQ